MSTNLGVLVTVLTAALLVGCQANPMRAPAKTLDSGNSIDGSGISVPTSCPSHAIAFETGKVSLCAEEFWIVADGLSYTSRGASVELNSDSGSTLATTLELVWTEHEREMRLNIYLKSDPSAWWADEIRTYNGQSPGDWLYYRGSFFQTPIGRSFKGDVDLTNGRSDGSYGQLHLSGMTLSTTLRGR